MLKWWKVRNCDGLGMWLERGRNVHTEFSRGNLLDSIKFEYPEQTKFYDQSSGSIIPLMKEQFAVTNKIGQLGFPH